MTLNNNVILIGNLGDVAKIHKMEDRLFATFSIATHESYKNDDDEYVQKAPIWHNVLVFKPDVVELCKTFEKGARVEVSGSLSYRPFSHKIKRGKTVNKQEASIIAYKIEPKPLAKKPEPSNP